MSRGRLLTWEAVGARVADARELAGFTQQQLADGIGVNRTVVTRIELGQRHLDALELSRLADTLGRPVEWFVTEPPDTIASHRAAWSSDPAVRRLEDALDRTWRDVELLADLRALRMPAPPGQPGVRDLRDSEERASDARRDLGVEAGPVLDLQKLVEKVGMLAFSFDLGPSVIDGGYVRHDDVGVALVNGSADAGRRRFNLAHELGHHILADEYTTEFGIGTSRDERESLIDAFAVHLLLPRAAVTQRWRELEEDWPEARSRLIIIAAEYRVSWSAVVSHAVTLGLIARGERAAIESRRPTRTDYLETGARFDEELAPVSLAPAYAQAALRAFRKSLISERRAVELLHGTVSIDDLPKPHEMPIDAVRADFEGLHGDR